MLITRPPPRAALAFRNALLLGFALSMGHLLKAVLTQRQYYAEGPGAHMFSFLAYASICPPWTLAREVSRDKRLTAPHLYGKLPLGEQKAKVIVFALQVVM